MDTPDTPEKPQASGTADGPLLDLTTLITRPTIRIDEEIFEILSPDEVSIIDSHRFGLWGRRIQALADIEGDDAEKELTELVSKVARKVTVGVPDEVFDKLPGAHRQAISDVFTGLLLRNRLGVAGAIAKAAGLGAVESSASKPIGERPSPASSGSSADSRSGGWLKRLRRWCGRS